MKSPTWHWDKQTITFNYWQFMVGGSKRKNATRGKQIGWHFGRQSSIKRLMAPITTDVGWVDLCFLCKACFWFLIIFFLQLCLYSDSLPCLFSDCERGAIRVYTSTITSIRIEVFHGSNRAALLKICPTQNQIKALSTCLSSVVQHQSNKFNKIINVSKTMYI